MTELAYIVGPPVEFMGSQAGSTGQKRVYRLRDLAPAGLTLNPGGASPFPDAVEIARAWIGDQSAMEYPAGTRGRISFGVDPLGLYSTESNFGPVEELCWPDITAKLAHTAFLPGVIDTWREFVFSDTPVRVRPEDLIVVAPEVWGADSRAFQCLFVIAIKAAGPWQVATGTVFRSKMTYDRYPGDATKFCLRSIVPAIKTGGTQVRVRLTSWKSGMSPAHVSIGVRDGATANMKAAPVPLALAGSTTISLPGYRSEDTDWADLVTAPNDELVVNISFLNPSNAWAGAKRRDRVSYYATDADSWASAAMLGSVALQSGTAEGRTQCVDCVQVR